MTEPIVAPSIARSSILMATGTIFSRILGLVRVSLQTWALGAVGAAADAWTNANSLPNIIYLLLAGGVLNAILVPQLTKAMTHRDGGQDFTDRLLTLALSALLATTIIFTLGSALLIKFYATSYTGDILSLAVAFAFICMPQVFFYGLYTLLGQILNSREKFWEVMWAPAAANIIGIAGLIAFLLLMPHAASPADWTPSMIWLLAGTSTAGVVLQSLVLLVPVWRSGFRYRPRWGFRGVGLRSASTVALWTFGIIGISQIGIWVTSNVINYASSRGLQLSGSASDVGVQGGASLASGGVAGRYAYEVASLLFILPHSLITLSLVTALFPRMSRAAHARNLTALRHDIRRGMKLIGIATVPASIGMFVLATSITATMLLKNTPHETTTIAYVMMALVVGLIPYGVLTLAWRVFYAFEDGKTPFRLQIVITAIVVAGSLASLLLPREWVAAGAGLSQAIGQTVCAVIAIIWVRRRVPHLGLYDVMRTYVRLVIAALLGAAAAWLVHLGLAQVISGRIGSLLTLGLGGVVLLAVYVLAARRMRVREMNELTTMVASRARRLLSHG